MAAVSWHGMTAGMTGGERGRATRGKEGTLSPRCHGDKNNCVRRKHALRWQQCLLMSSEMCKECLEGERERDDLLGYKENSNAV